MFPEYINEEIQRIRAILEKHGFVFHGNRENWDVLVCTECNDEHGYLVVLSVTSMINGIELTGKLRHEIRNVYSASLENDEEEYTRWGSGTDPSPEVAWAKAVQQWTHNENWDPDSE